jgi:hypothetical protein
VKIAGTKLALGPEFILRNVNEIGLSGAVDVRAFGAVVGDGVVNDTVAVRAAHVYANALGLPVSYAGISTLALDANAAIPIKTSTDFYGCKIVILGGVNETPSFSTFNNLFVVSDDACPYEVYTGAITSGQLVAGSRTPTLGVRDGPGVAFLRANTGVTVPDREKTGTLPYSQTFNVHRFGFVSHPLAVDLTASAADMTIEYREMSERRLIINAPSIKEGAWNNQRIFQVRRSNVEINGLTVPYVKPDTSTFANICELISCYLCSDVEINGFVSTGRRFSASNGTYCLALYSCADVRVRNMKAITGWGALGTNDCSGLYFDDCVINRVDAHSGGFNFFVNNCEIHDIGVVYGWGGGVISVTNSRAYNCPVISKRVDYGGSFFGDLVVDNVEMHYPTTSQLIAVDLATNALGASGAVFAPVAVRVSNLSRIGIASANGAEFIPVAIKVLDASSVVYAPKEVFVDTVKANSAPNGWRFGMRLDVINMEHSANGEFRVVIRQVMAQWGATSATGVLDYDSIRTPSANVQLRMFVHFVENLHIRMRSVNGPLIFVRDCLVNGISVVASGTRPRVDVADCAMLQVATGYTNAPIGGGRSGNANYTSIVNCDFGATAAAAYDCSGVSLAVGNTVRTGATLPLIPAAATIDTMFTGFREAGAFQ